jgi:hypothetical protein
MQKMKKYVPTAQHPAALIFGFFKRISQGN